MRIGTFGDNLVSRLIFIFEDLNDENIIYKLKLKFSDGCINSVLLGKPVTDSNISSLEWNVKQEDIYCHGMIQAQIEGRTDDEKIFQTKIFSLFADESISLEGAVHNNPYSEILELREETYRLLEKAQAISEILDGISSPESLRSFSQQLDLKADKSDTYTAAQVNSLLENYAHTLSSADKSDIANMVKSELDLIEQPRIVSRVEDMVNTNKAYVLSDTGNIWSYVNTTSTNNVTEAAKIKEGDTYHNGRITSSGDIANDVSDMVVTPLIDLSQYSGEITLTLSGAYYAYPTSTANVRLCVYDENLSKIEMQASYPQGFVNAGLISNLNQLTINGNTCSIRLNLPVSMNNRRIKYLRFSGNGTSAQSSITVSYRKTTTGEQWVDTGLSYLPKITEPLKQEIAQRAANIIDAELLEIIGEGDIA